MFNLQNTLKVTTLGSFVLSLLAARWEPSSNVALQSSVASSNSYKRGFTINYNPALWHKIIPVFKAFCFNIYHIVGIDIE